VPFYLHVGVVCLSKTAEELIAFVEALVVFIPANLTVNLSSVCGRGVVRYSILVTFRVKGNEEKGCCSGDKRTGSYGVVYFLFTSYVYVIQVQFWVNSVDYRLALACSSLKAQPILILWMDYFLFLIHTFSH
jgi:hypothetical protein